MFLPKDRALTLVKESEHYFVHLYLKEKIPTTITRPKEDSVMYLRQSCQTLNLKKRSIMTDHQQHHRGAQMSALVLSLKVSPPTW